MVAAMRVQSLFDLTGRAAVVTGGGTHLGRAMAEALGELGAAVYVASRDRARCEHVAAELRAGDLDVTGLGCDVTIEAEVDALVARVMADRGRLDVMVCNAGGAFTTYHAPQCILLDSLDSPFPDPCEVGTGPTIVPPGFLSGHARVP